MKLIARTIFVFCMIVAPFWVNGNTCVDPDVTSKVYTTTESSSSTETVFIVQFSLSCKNGAKIVNLYADFNGKTVAATRTDDNKYQVSFSDNNKNLPAGSYDVKFYDDDGYSSLRRAQRSGESSDSIASIFSVKVNHPGVWHGPVVQSEFAAALVAILVWWYAYSTRQSLQSS